MVLLCSTHRHRVGKTACAVLADAKRRTACFACVLRAIVSIALLVLAAVGSAQEIEPRSYTGAPIGVNFIVAGYAYTQGGLAFDPSLPIDQVHLATSSAIFGYARTLDVAGLSGKVDVVIPYAWLSGSADYIGQPVSRSVNGLGDPRFRFSVNLYGAPAMTASDFRTYRQDVIVGASLQVTVPSGQYDSSRIVNLGAHRWSFKPELGISKAIGRWIWETTAGVTFYSDNNEFFGGNVRSQDPLYSVQGHTIYNFASGIWLSADATFYAGARTSINGVLDNNLEQNWRVGTTLSVPIDRRASVKLAASDGVSTRTGNNFSLFGIFWQYRWGGGL